MRLASIIIIAAAFAVAAVFGANYYFGNKEQKINLQRQNKVSGTSNLPERRGSVADQEDQPGKEPAATQSEDRRSYMVDIANSCGSQPLPIKLREGSYFVYEEAVIAMGGNMEMPMFWRGDNSHWVRKEAEFYIYNGARGVLVEGTGPGYMRWNLFQPGRGSKGWLKIQKAYENFSEDGCKFIYQNGKVLANGEDPQGIGPAFAEVR